jgi:hypothetical protein
MAPERSSRRGNKTTRSNDKFVRSTNGRDAKLQDDILLVCDSCQPFKLPGSDGRTERVPTVVAHGLQKYMKALSKASGSAQKFAAALDKCDCLRHQQLRDHRMHSQFPELQMHTRFVPLGAQPVSWDDLLSGRPSDLIEDTRCPAIIYQNVSVDGHVNQRIVPWHCISIKAANLPRVQ